MDRLSAPTEFGFTTPPYIPPERPRPAWRTLLFGALLALIPIVGPGVSAVYVDRRRIPSTYEFSDALKTALIQAVALAVLALLVGGVLVTMFGFSVRIDAHIGR
jgi:ABC-type Fe3+ transport system permease subunit